MVVVLGALWEAINAEDSWWPFVLPLGLWIVAFLYCYLPSNNNERPVFHKWSTLHNFFNYTAIVLGVASLYFNDDTVFNERIVILWSLSYFSVDLIDCLIRGDVAFSLHAVFCLVIGVWNHNKPLCREIRANSKAMFFELSSPFLVLAKQTRKPHHFAMFAIVFTVCRIVWIPILIYSLQQHDMPLTDPYRIVLTAFYGLNLYWYYKVSAILLLCPQTNAYSQLYLLADCSYSSCRKKEVKEEGLIYLERQSYKA